MVHDELVSAIKSYWKAWLIKHRQQHLNTKKVFSILKVWLSDGLFLMPSDNSTKFKHVIGTIWNQHKNCSKSLLFGFWVFSTVQMITVCTYITVDGFLIWLGTGDGWSNGRRMSFCKAPLKGDDLGLPKFAIIPEIRTHC
jgi:hypothetical protein